MYPLRVKREAKGVFCKGERQDLQSIPENASSGAGAQTSACSLAVPSEKSKGDVVGGDMFGSELLIEILTQQKIYSGRSAHSWSISHLYMAV